MRYIQAVDIRGRFGENGERKKKQKLVHKNLG